jgi:hypothetical protein
MRGTVSAVPYMSLRDDEATENEMDNQCTSEHCAAIPALTRPELSDSIQKVYVDYHYFRD